MDRRDLLVMVGAWALGGCTPQRTATSAEVGGLFSGRVDDGGFMQAGYAGLMKARDELGFRVRVIDRVPSEREALARALRDLAQGGARLVVAHGGQNNEAALIVAAEFPQCQFVVSQGNVFGRNLASYEVLQEQSTWLAGATAGLLTKSNIVGHMSGIRVPPGLKARAAFADGLRTTNPQARFLTNFSGTQDDPAVARRVCAALIDAGADIVYTMLNAGRSGAIEVCRERKVPQIGNVGDWVAQAPDVFVGSAFADSGVAVTLACRDFAAGKLRVGAVSHIGLEQPTAIRMILADRVPATLKQRIAGYQADIVAGRIKIPETYAGPDFNA